MPNNPGPVNYYFPNPNGEPARTGYTEISPYIERWRPGFAGFYERSLMGNGEKDGWFIYAVGQFVVVELWINLSWKLTRWIDCSLLLEIPSTEPNNILHHCVMFGFDIKKNLLSLGVVTHNPDRSSPDKQRAVYQEWFVPNLNQIFIHPPEVFLGDMSVLMQNGSNEIRHNLATGIAVFPLRGQFTSPDYLSRGELSRIAGTLVAETQTGVV
jgi:hypothetical protein